MPPVPPGNVLPPRRFAGAYREDLTLADGTAVRIRLVQPEDKALLREGFERLSPRSRYRRFFGGKPKLNDRELAYLTEVDGTDHVAIGAVRLREDGSEEPLGVARFIRLAEEPHAAEAAMAVVDDAQRRGLGTALLERLIAAATERGITHFRVEVVAENSAVRAWLAHAPDATEHAERGVLIVDLQLPNASGSHTPASLEPNNAAYRLLRETACERAALARPLTAPRPPSKPRS